MSQESPLYDMDLEQAVLGSMIARRGAVDRFAGEIEARHFYDPLHQRIFDMAVYLQTEGDVTPVVLSSVLRNDPANTADLPVRDYIMALSNAAPSIPAVTEMSGRLKDLSLRRVLNKIGGDLEKLTISQEEDRNSREIAEVFTEEMLLATADGQRKAVTPYEAGLEAIREMEDAAAGRAIPVIPTGIGPLDKELGGLRGGDLTTILGKSGMGKAQPVAAPVLMADGSWRPIGGLQVGDALASVDGAPSTVIGVHRRGTLPTFTVTFSDGRATTVCGDHLWEVRHTNNFGWLGVQSTDEVRRLMQKKTYRRRVQVPKVSGDFGAQTNFALHPYVLGCLLGDGNLTGSAVRLTSADPELIARVKSLLPDGATIGPVSGSYAFSIRAAEGYFKGKFGSQRTGNPVQQALRQLGLYGLDAEEKFVPAPYLRANRGQRLELLRGLLDTDGWAEKHGAVRFSSCSRRLSEAVVELVRSLGGVASIVEKKTSCNGKAGKVAYVCRIRHEAGETLFALQRKAARAKRISNRVSLAFRSIEPAGEAECVCISVSHPRRLYITEDYIVTHNSALMCRLSLLLAAANIPTIVFSLEMSQRQWVERMVCDLDFDTATSPMWYSRVRNHQMRDGEFSRFVLANQKLESLPLEIVDAITAGTMGMPQISARSRAFASKHKGRRIAVIGDYLQLVEPFDQRENRERQVGRIAYGLKYLSQRLDAPVIFGSQMNEKDEERQAKERRPRASDARESRGIMNASDIMLAPYRAAAKVYDQRPLSVNNDSPEMIEWASEFNKVKNDFDILCLKNRHGRRFDLRLWAEIGANAIRDATPDRRMEPANEDVQGLLAV